MRLPRLSMPEFSGRWDTPELLSDFMRRLVDRSQRNNDELRDAANTNEAGSGSKARAWWLNAGL